jgi:hypothetical protein
MGKEENKDGKPSNDFKNNASNVMISIGKKSDKAEHAIVSAVKGIGKNNSAAGKDEKNMNGAGGSSNNTMSEFGKKASQAGTALEKSMNNMGKQAGKQIAKAEHEIGADKTAQSQTAAHKD